jgi:hypothetical protein
VTDEVLSREAERAALDGAYRRARSGEPQLVVLWGRRRVGKTFLLSRFVEGRRAVFFGATEQAEAIELGRLAAAVREGLGDAAGALAGPSFRSWETALRWFAAMAKDEPLVLVLDEVPYLLESTPGFASIVQVVWDHLARGTKLMLVLTGSSVGVIEGMLGEGAALRGRPTLPMRLEPLDAVGARAFLPRLPATDFFQAFAACGGYPLHLRAWDPDETWEVNLRRLAGSPGGLLLEDARGLLLEELSGASGYNRILAAVGRGRTRYGEIANEAGQRVEGPLETLVRAGFLRRAIPVGAPKGATPAYEIGDPYLAFWFSCLYANQTEIEAGQGKAVLARIAPLWQRHLGWAFEEAARAHAARLVTAGGLGPELTNLIVGRWWTTSGTPCEVDVLGLHGGKSELLGEVRWQPQPLGLRELDQARRKLPLVPRASDNCRLALWGCAGVKREVTATGALGFALEDVLSLEPPTTRRASRSRS